MTVYADILFLVNFSMDFLTLYMTAAFCHVPYKKYRLIAGAAAGGFFGTLFSVLPYLSSGLLTAAAGCFLSILMVWTAFSGMTSRKILIRLCLAVWGAGSVLGGVMTFLLSLGEPIYSEYNGNTRAFAPVFLACFMLSSVLIRVFSSMGRSKSVFLTISCADEEIRITALYDSGSFIRDPISGFPVVVVGKGILRKTEEKLRKGEKTLRVRVIPAEGIGGNTVLYGFVPDRICVNGTERSAVVAVHPWKTDFAGYHAVIPACLY